MLLELRIENLLLIDRAELRPGDGLNAITGETGAGKTVLAHALDLLLGGKPRSSIVRPGAKEAYVEGVFELPPGVLEAPELADLRERCAQGDEGEVVLARRVSEEGRTRAYVQGRSATVADLRELGAGWWPSSASTSTAGSPWLRLSSSFSTASAAPSTWRCATGLRRPTRACES